MHEGHRLRILEKLKENANALQEHELLEILLFNAVPRKNTNPLAHELLKSFGSIKRVFDADVNALMTVKGVGLSTASYLAVVGRFFQEYKAEEQGTMPAQYDANTFPDFLVKRFQQESCECVDFYFLNERGNILSRKVFTNRSKEQVVIDSKEVLRLIGQEGIKALVLAHNHVEGTCRPSPEADDLTSQIVTVCSVANVRLLDHFICAGEKFYSYYNTGKMFEITHNFHIQNIIKR